MNILCLSCCLEGKPKKRNLILASCNLWLQGREAPLLRLCWQKAKSIPASFSHWPSRKLRQTLLLKPSLGSLWCCYTLLRCIGPNSASLKTAKAANDFQACLEFFRQPNFEARITKSCCEDHSLLSAERPYRGRHLLGELSRRAHGHRRAHRPAF